MADESRIKQMMNLLKNEPKNMDAFKALQEHYHFSQNWKQLCELYQFRADAIKSEESTESARLYFKSGEVQEKHLAGAEHALSSYQTAFSMHPRQKSYGQKVAEIYILQQNWQKALEILHRQLEYAQEKQDKIDVLSKIAFLYRDKIQNREEAKKCFLQILQIHSQHPLALQVLGTFYYEDKQWQDLLRIYQLQLSITKDNEAKKRLLLQGGGLAINELKDWKLAIQFYNQLLTIVPNDEKILKTLEDLYTKEQDWKSLVVVMGKRVELISENDVKSQFLIQMADLWREKVENNQEAIRCCEQALALDETDIVLKKLEEMYLYQEDWKKLIGIYKKQAIRTQDRQIRISLYSKVGELAKNKLKNMDLAIKWYQAALKDVPENFEILKILQELLEKENRKEELVQYLRQELKLVSEQDEKLAIYEKITNVYKEMDQLNETANVYEEMSQLYPKHAPIIENLKEIYSKLQNWALLVQTLEKEVALNPHAKETIDLYLKIADLLTEKLQNEKQAISHYHKVLEINSSRLDIWNKVKEYYFRNNQYPELINAIDNIAKLDEKTAVEGHLEIAKIYRDKVRDATAAISSYQKVLVFDKKNLRAIKALSSLYEEGQAWDEYINVQKRHIELAGSNQDLIALHFSLCRVYAQRNQQTEFELHLRHILQVDIRNGKAVEGLKQLYQSQQNWGKLVAILEKEAQCFIWESSILFIKYREIARLFLENLQKEDKSIYYYEKARHLEPNNWEILGILEKLYQQKEDYHKLIRILTVQSTLCTKEEDANRYRYRIGEIWKNNLKDPSQAISVFGQVVASDMFHLESLKHLEELHVAREEYEALVSVYLKKAKIAKEPAKLVELYFKAGLLLEEKLQKVEKSSFMYEKVLEINNSYAPVINQLLKLYRKEEKWVKLSVCYHQKIEITENNEDKAKLCFELAAIYRDRLELPYKAIDVFSEVLKLKPGNLEAIYALKDLHSKLQNWNELLTTLHTEYGLATEEEKRKTILVQMAEICEEHLMDFIKAISFHLEYTKIDSKHIESYRSLRRLYYKDQNIEKVVWSIDQELPITTNPSEQITLFLEKGNLCQKHLLNLELAILSFESVLKIASNNMKAYEALITIHSEQKSYEKLIDVLMRQLEHCSQEKQKEIHLECARIWEEELKNDKEAKTSLRAILTLEKEHILARRRLESICSKCEEWQELIEVYQQEIEFTQEQSRLCWLHYAIGKVTEKELHAPLEAIAMYQKILELDSQHLAAITSLQRIYEDANNYVELLKVYQAEIVIPNIEPQRRIYLHLTMADLQRFYLDDINGAALHYQSTLDLKLDPNNLTAIRGLQEIYETIEKHKELQAMFFKELELQKNPQRLIEVHLQLAYLMEEKLGDLDVAVEHFAEAHLSRPSNLPILRRLKKLLQQQQQWEKYAEIVEKEIVLCSGKLDLIPLHEELVSVYSNKLQNPPKAIEHGEAILALDEKHLATTVSLGDLYKLTDDNAKLAAVYLQEASLRLDIVDKDRLIFLHTEAGKLYSSLLDDLSKAIYCYEEVLKLDLANKEALSCLVNIFMGQKKWDDLLTLYNNTVKITRNRGEVEILQMKIAELWEKEFTNDPKALLHYQIAYSMNQKNLAAIMGMRRILERQERWADAIEILNVEVHLMDEKRQPALYLKMGEYWEERLGMPHQALTCYLKVMGHGFHRATAERIMRIQEQVEDYQGLVEILEKDIRVTENPEELATKLLYLGKIQWKHLKNLDEAIDAYSKVLKPSPNNMEAIDALIEISKIKKKWKELIVILNRKRENLTDPEQLCVVHCEIAKTYQKRLHAGNIAIKHYEHALDITPHDLSIIHTLQKLYKEWGLYKKLIVLYQKEIQLVENQERIIFLHSHIGSTLEKYLFDDEQAIGAYEQLLKVASDHLESTRALARLYPRYHFWDKLIPIYHTLIKDAQEKENVEEEIRIQMNLGKVNRDETNNAEAAIVAFTRILELDPAHPEALTATEDLYKGLGRSRDMAILLSQKIGLCTTDEDRLELYIHLGNLYEKELDDPDHAIDAFEYARSLRADHPDVLKALDWLYLRKKQWGKLVEICEEEIKLVEEESEEKAELYFRIGTIQRDRFKKPDIAKQYFLKSIEHQSNFRKSLKGLTGLAIRDEDWTQAVKYIAMEISHIQDPDEKVQALTDLGTLYLNKLKLIQKAKEAFQLALDIDPQSPVALEAMADIHFTQLEWQHAEPLFSRLMLLVAEDDSGRLSDICYKAGQISEKLGKKDEAIIRYNNSLEAKENHLESLLAIGNLYYERAQWGFDKAQWQEALDIYEKVLVHEKLEDKRDIVRRLALIHKNLGMIDEAITYYKKVLGEYPDDMESTNALASLHIEKNEDTEALKYLHAIVKGEGSFIDRRNSLLTMGEVYTRLENYNEAIEANLKAFSMGLEDHSILRKQAELYIKVSKWPEAAKWLNDHYTCIEDTKEKAENRCLMAKIQLEGLDDSRKAIQLYEQALDDDATCTPAIQGIATIYEKSENWKALVGYYQKFLNNLPEDSNFMGLPIHLALGKLYAEKLDNPTSAISELTKALSIDTNHFAVHAALASIKTQDPNLWEDAVEEHKYLLKREPNRISSYRSLFRIYSSRDELDSALRACRALNFFGELITQEKDFLANTQTRKISTTSYNSVLDLMIGKKVGVHHEIMDLAGEHMVKAYPPDLESKYGLKKKDRLGVDIQHPVVFHSQKICSILGIEALDLYINPRRTHKVFLENTQPASLIISQALVDALSDLELRFLFAKYLFYVSQKQLLVTKLEEKEIGHFFTILKDWFTQGSMTNSELEPTFKRVKGGLPRKIRKVLEERNDLWSGLDKTDISDYFQSLEFASNRCALLVSDSLDLTIEMIYRLHILNQTGKLVKLEQLPKDIAKQEAISDILLFNLSDEYSQLRKRSNLA